MPLRIETGRYSTILDAETGLLRKLNVEERTCNICKQNFVEDEKHFLFTCDVYDEERKNLMDYCQSCHIDFEDLTENEKLKIVINNEWKMAANFIFEIWNKRKNCEYQ